jgi:hypothetical protein
MKSRFSQILRKTLVCTVPKSFKSTGVHGSQILKTNTGCAFAVMCKRSSDRDFKSAIAEEEVSL